MTDALETAPSAPTTDVPAEVRTFLFADVRGYTRFTQEQGDVAAAALVARFAEIVRTGVRVRGGRMLELRGDEVLAVFGSARGALRAALELQTAFADATKQDPTLPLNVGIGLEAGEAIPLEGGYRGEALNLAARLCNLAGPGEVLTTEGVVYLGRRLTGVRYLERGNVPLKGFGESVRVIRVVTEDGAMAVEPAAVAAREAQLPIGGYLGALPAGALVGREDEWARIMAALDEAAHGSSRFVLLSGEPGVGKTRLAQEVTLKAQHWGFIVAPGRCYEPEGSVPFYPFLEVLATLYGACSAGLRQEIPHRWPHLSRLLPEQIGVTPEGGSGGREDQQWLFRAVTHLLEAIAGEMPVAILLDDLHWADDSSLKLVQHIARYCRTSRVLLLGTYRDVEVHRQHPLESLLLDLGRELLVEEIPIRRLDQSGTAEFMAELLGHGDDLADLVDLVHGRTDGNAFFVQEMVHALVENGSVYRKDGHWERRRVEEMEVPKSVRSVIGQRLSRLDDVAQDLLRQASVLGGEFTFDDLLALDRAMPSHYAADGADARSRTEDDVDRALQGAIEAGLVRETDGESFAFNHAITQQALYSELSTRRRKRLHLAAGRILERLPEKVLRRRAGELAWHFLEADDPEHAFRYAVMAGEQAEEVFANGEVERHYRTALELSRELEDEEREALALERLAGVLTVEAKYDKALDLLERAARLHGSLLGNHEGERCVVAKIGEVHFQRGTRVEGIQRLQPMVTALDYDPEGTPPSAGYAGLYAALARLYMGTGRFREQLAAAERAVELARAIGDDRIAVGAEITRTEALWELGQDDDALRVIEEVIPRAEAAGDLNNLTMALSHAALYYARRGEFEKDRAYHQRALTLAERRGDRGQIVFALMNLSANHYLVGEWDRSRLYVERAGSITRTLPVSRLSTWPAGALAWLDLRQGRLDDAGSHAEALMAYADARGDDDWRRLGLRVLAERALDLGDPDGAFRYLEPVLGQEGWKTDAGFLRTLGWTYLHLGNLASAVETIARAIAHARSNKDQPELVETLAVWGAVQSASETWDDASQTFEYALAGAHSMRFLYGEARVLTEYGRMQAIRGHTDRARELLKAAVELYTRLGAAVSEQSVRSELDTL